LILIILPPEFPTEVVNHLRTLVMFYKTYGIQYMIWYLLMYLFRGKGSSFMEIKAVYDLLRKKKLSNGTIGDLVKRMEKKGIIVKMRTRYYAGIKDDKLVLEAIDATHVGADRRSAQLLLETLAEYRMAEKTVKRGSRTLGG